jgi:hypothetical protein
MSSVGVQGNSNGNMYLQACGIALAGGVGTGAYEYFVNKQSHCVRNDMPTDTFVKKVQDKLGSTTYNEVDKIAENGKNMLKQDIDKLTTTTEVKEYLLKQLNNYKPSGHWDINSEKALLESFAKLDLAQAKDVAKASLDMPSHFGVGFGNVISGCWDQESKMFVNKDNKISKEVFNVIEKTAQNIRKSTAMKEAGITVGITALIEAIYLACTKKGNKE